MKVDLKNNHNFILFLIYTWISIVSVLVGKKIKGEIVEQKEKKKNNWLFNSRPRLENKGFKNILYLLDRWNSRNASPYHYIIEVIHYYSTEYSNQRLINCWKKEKYCRWQLVETRRRLIKWKLWNPKILLFTSFHGNRRVNAISWGGATWHGRNRRIKFFKLGTFSFYFKICSTFSSSNNFFVKNFILEIPVTEN